MKNLIVLLVVLLKVCATEAQYTVNYTPTGSNYLCTIAPSQSIYDFDEYDLITWIFPDGQFKQQTIERNLVTGQVINSSTFTWQPSQAALSGPGEIIAYVAKKGKPGNPSRNTNTNANPVVTTTGTPAPFSMTPGKKWQINTSWEFSPNRETFLIVSYRTTCTTNKISLSFNTDQLNDTGENLAYQNESVVPISLGSNSKKIEISNLRNNGVINHVYIKFKLTSAVSVASFFRIDLGGDDCGSPIDTFLVYQAKGNPHDPNEKICSHRIVCPANANQTDLIYYLKFQNDGDDFVDSVEIRDNLPNQLIRGTFSLGNVPDFHRVYGGFDWIGQNEFFILFKDLHLPGLKQTNPHYAYDQTTYAFDFNICALNNLPLNDGFINAADVYFYDKQNKKLPAVRTSDAKVSVESVPTCYKASVNCTVPTVEQAGIISNLSTSPNPFSEEIQIFIELKEKTRLGVIVRDMNGRIIDKIIDSQFISGAHQLSWNGAIIPAGIYLLDVYTEHGRVTRKMIKM